MVRSYVFEKDFPLTLRIKGDASFFLSERHERNGEWEIRAAEERITLKLMTQSLNEESGREKKAETG